MKTNHLLLIAVTIVTLLSYGKSNEYTIVKKKGDMLYVDRKGSIIKFYDATNYYKEKDKIRLLMDFDINYELLKQSK